jgi:hypothetical protein
LSVTLSSARRIAFAPVPFVSNAELTILLLTQESACARFAFSNFGGAPAKFQTTLCNSRACEGLGQHVDLDAFSRCQCLNPYSAAQPGML